MAILDRLRGQFKDSTNFRKFLTDMAQTMDDLSTTIEDLRTKTDLDNAVGEQIDRNGAMIGVNRQGLSDADYKTLQDIKIRVNKSNGSLPEILSIVEDLANLFTLDPSPPVPVVTEIVEDFPAKYRANLTTFLDESFKDIIRLMVDQSTATGIGFGILHGGDNDGTNRFAYGTVGKGYGSGAKYTGVI